MPLIRRNWTPAAADDWTKEDWLAIVLSPLAYIGFAVGVALSILVIPMGFIILAVAIVLTIILHWIIDPKLKTISEEYEQKQKKYLLELEKMQRWEDVE